MSRSVVLLLLLSAYASCVSAQTYSVVPHMDASSRDGYANVNVGALDVAEFYDGVDYVRLMCNHVFSCIDACCKLLSLTQADLKYAWYRLQAAGPPLSLGLHVVQGSYHALLALVEAFSTWSQHQPKWTDLQYVIDVSWVLSLCCLVLVISDAAVTNTPQDATTTSRLLRLLSALWSLLVPHWYTLVILFLLASTGRVYPDIFLCIVILSYQGDQWWDVTWCRFVGCMMLWLRRLVITEHQIVTDAPELMYSLAVLTAVMTAGKIVKLMLRWAYNLVAVLFVVVLPLVIRTLVNVWSVCRPIIMYQMKGVVASSVLVATTDFPMYVIQMVGEANLLVTGGGGHAKTGVPNALEVYNIKPTTGSCKLQNVARHHIAEGAAMNGCVAKGTKTGYTVCSLGIDDSCHTYRVKPFLHSPNTLSYDLVHSSSLKTDFDGESGYQKCVRYTSDGLTMFTGGADGFLRAWDIPDIILMGDGAVKKNLYTRKAHSADIDDICVSPDDRQVVSIGKDHKACIWNSRTGERVKELTFTSQHGVKYGFRAARYSPDGDLYTLNVPAIRGGGRKSPPCYVCKWNTSTWQVEPVSIGYETASAFAMATDGLHLAVGTMEGSVSIHRTSDLYRVYHKKDAHTIFVTALEFAPSTTVTENLTGNPGQTVFSVSVDRQIQMHQVEQIKGRAPALIASIYILGYIFVYQAIVRFGL